MSEDIAIKLSEIEDIKENSNYLRGTIKEGLADPITGAISPDDTQLLKFHGSYQQQDRDLESERKHQKLEPLYQFMIRVRMPGGMASAHQWEVIDEISDRYAGGTIKLTTRQAFQLHGVFKPKLKASIQEINNALLDTIAACGDVNRNVMCNPNPYQSPVHSEVYELASGASKLLLPRSTAYHEIWLDKKLVAGQEDKEPIYGKNYLPRKFKIAFAIPPYNDVDLFANDLGFIAIEENGELTGFNIAIGGGMGMTFGNEATYPRLADVIGYIPKGKINQVIEEVVKIQRDNGNRSDRKNARFKYTIDRMGLETVREELQNRLGWKLKTPKPFKFESNGDTLGWTKGIDEKWYLTLFIEGGRVRDTDKIKLKTALRQISHLNVSDFRLTGNQNLVLGKIDLENKKKVEDVLKKHKVLPQEELSGMRRNSISCVALNTCGLAFAEAERYLPSLIDKIEIILKENGLYDEDIVIRMTGCPNGCGRPYLGEIAFVGRAPGVYNMYLGAGFSGNRLNKLYREMVHEEEILKELKKIIAHYAREREKGERFGDFVIRAGYVKETVQGTDFHQ